jgi:hypothetical protein
MRRIPYILAAILIFPIYAVIAAFLWLCHQADLRGQKRFKSGIIERKSFLRIVK